MGDIVLTTPVIRCAHQQAEAEVHVVVKKAFASLLQNNPHVHQVHTYDGDFAALVQTLKGLNVDIVIDLHNSLRSKRLRRALKCPKTAVVRKFSLQKWLFSDFRINLLPDTHVVEKYFAAAAKTGISNDGMGCEIFLTPAETDEISRVYPQFNSQKWIALVIGAAHNGKRTPVEKWKAIIPLLQAPIVLIGGAEDREMAAEIEQAFPQVLNTAGLHSIRQSAGIIAQAAAVIANDTGMMHVAAAFHKPVISLWGQTVPQFGMYPYMPGKGSAIIQPTVPGRRRISKLGNKRERVPHQMTYLDAEAIAQAANSALGLHSK
jgi:ADP-heptose:LPS heptosyltransferase